MRKLHEFFRKEDGLTTTEWVVLCAVVLLAAMGISSFVLQSAEGLGGAVAGQMDAAAEEVD
jgi:Flp pilus assembly pilin Flp